MGAGHIAPHRDSNPVVLLVIFLFKYYYVAGTKLLNLLIFSVFKSIFL